MPSTLRQSQIKELLRTAKELANDDLMSRSEFVALLKEQIVPILQKIKEDAEKDRVEAQRRVEEAVAQVSEKERKQVKQEVKQEVDRLQETADSLLSEIRVALETIDKGVQDQQNAIDFLHDRVARLKDGKTPTREELEAIIRPLIPEVTDGEDGKDADPAAVLDLVMEMLPEPQEMKDHQEEIEKLQEEIEELKKRPTGGGGVTNARITQAFKYILKTEAPTGDIDGANTTYTVTQPIFAVFAFSLNGEVIAQLPNYTIAGNTITFSTALPAAYSGKDFEIKYI